MATIVNEQAAIRSLITSYKNQLDIYEKLTVLVQKIVGQLALSRGDLSGVISLLEMKQQLFESITTERALVDSQSAFWTENKERLASCVDAKELTNLLALVETSIMRFLDCEDQLKRYIEHAQNGGV